MREQRRRAARDSGRGARRATTAAEAEARRLVDAYGDMIVRLSCTYLKSTHDAQDICQTVLIKLIGRAEAFDGPEHEKAWVIRATANACKDLLRSAERRTRAPLEAAADRAVPEEPDDDVLEAVMALDEKYREALYLHYYEGYSIREIAALTGRSEAAVGAHLSRGRAKLRAMLEEDDEAGTALAERTAAQPAPSKARDNAPRAPDAAVCRAADDVHATRLAARPAAQAGACTARR